MFVKSVQPALKRATGSTTVSTATWGGRKLLTSPVPLSFFPFHLQNGIKIELTQNGYHKACSERSYVALNKAPTRRCGGSRLTVWTP